MKIRYISLAVISVAAASIFTTSCVKEDFRNGASTGKVIIDVNTDNAVDTKSGSSTRKLETLELNADGATLFLSGTESLYNENPFTGRMATKGSIIGDGREGTLGDESINSEGKKFKLTILNNNGIYQTINGTPAKGVVAQYDPAGVETKWPLLTEVDWPETTPKSLDFWAYYDANNNATPSGDGYSSYKYKWQSHDTDGMDAARTSDFLIANTNGATQNNVSIHFYHALSAIRFNVDGDAFRNATWTDDDGNVHESYKSIKIRISGIYNSGDVEYDSTNADMFDWDFADTDLPNGVYEQVLFDRSKADTDGFDEDGYAILTNRTFFIVPQTVGPTTDALFTFTIIDGDNHETVLSADNVGTTLWKPGYIYKYNVGTDKYGNVGVAVREGEDGNTFNGTEKENVRFELTKSAASYLRARVVANWCLPNGKVYKAYTGTYKVTNNWVLASDGFYYSKHLVLGHSESKDFMSEFSPNQSEPTSAYDLHLEMKFLVQAISFDVKDGDEGRAEWAWGDVFRGLLNDGLVIPTIE